MLPPIIVGGNFNAHAMEWGSPTIDSRSECTLQWTSLDFVLLNRGRISTFMGARRESVYHVGDTCGHPE